MDNGANTCILSQRFHVVEENPTRMFRVVGLDKELETNNLPIFTTMFVFESRTGDRILIQFNEAVCSKTVDHSLMST